MTSPSFTLSAKAGLQDEKAKQNLVGELAKEKASVAAFMDAFYGQARRTEASHVELCHNIINTVDRVLKAGDWESSLFLRNTVKPLKDIRDEAEAVLRELKNKDVEESFELPSVAADRIELYVSLYQAEGHDLRKWAAQLDSLPSYMVGRPVYASEADITNMIRRKAVQAVEAYVVVEVEQKKVLSASSRQRQDREGSPLVALVEGSVSVANIREFVHMGQRFYFKNHRLIPKERNKKVA